MAKRMVRGSLYRAARVMGDVEAAGKGPGSLAKRAVRKQVYRRTNSVTGQLLRAMGLQGGGRRR